MRCPGITTGVKADYKMEEVRTMTGQTSYGDTMTSGYSEKREPDLSATVR